MTTWGVYNLQGKLPDGTHVSGDDRGATRWFVRWRADGVSHKKTFKAKGYAKTFRAKLLAAQGLGWPADSSGFPIDPSETRTTPAEDAVPAGPSFEEYCETIWYPTAKSAWGDKNRLSHRRNTRLAIEYLVYDEWDRRLDEARSTEVGSSILLEDLVPDDNQRRVVQAPANGSDLRLDLEVAAPATVRSFYITLAMILRAAQASGLTPRDPLAGTAKHAPKPGTKRISQRVVPSIDEVFDLADAIAALGPLGRDGRPLGERFRSLVLAAGTLGPRPGELAAHRPSWIDWHSEQTTVRFHATEASVYDTEEGIRGRRTKSLKHRDDDEWREFPALASVADALHLHLERGYGSADRTWTSVNGKPLDWHNIMDTYWRPARAKVFSASSKPLLAGMTPSLLRKSAVTFWLDAGINPLLAADWAGHSEDVSRRYYAGRSAMTLT